MKERMTGDAGYPPPMDNKRWGPSILNEFDENPGAEFIDKGINWGYRGVILGAIAGSFHAAVIDPPAKVNGFTYALRHAGVASVMFGAFGATLGVGIPLAQAIRKKNDPWAWAWGGFAAGSVFGLRNGRLGLALQIGATVGSSLCIAKTCGCYIEPFDDPLRSLRAPPPKHLKILDENGQIIPNPQQYYTVKSL